MSTKASTDWISVEERLPEDETIVLAYERGVYVAHFIARKMFFVHDRDHEFMPDVTHWMPLPHPPQSETDAE